MNPAELAALAALNAQRAITATATVTGSAASTLANVAAALANVQSTAGAVIKNVQDSASTAVAEAKLETRTSGLGMQYQVDASGKKVKAQLNPTIQTVITDTKSWQLSAGALLKAADEKPSAAASTQAMNEAVPMMFTSAVAYEAMQKEIAAKVAASDAAKVELLRKADAARRAAANVAASAKAAQNANAKTYTTLTRMDKAPETSIFDIGAGLNTLAGMTAAQINSYVKNPVTLLQGIQSTATKLAAGDKIENKVVGNIVQAIAPIESLYTTLYKQDLFTGQKKNPDAGQLFDTVLTIGCLALGETPLLAKGAATGAGKNALKLAAENVPELVAAMGETATERAIAQLSDVFGGIIIKDAQLAAKRVVKNEVAELAGTVARLKGEPVTLGQAIAVKAAELTRAGDVLPETKVIIELAKNYPLKAAALVKRNADDFLKLPTADRMAVIETMGAKMANKAEVEAALKEVGIVLTKPMSVGAKAGWQLIDPKWILMGAVGLIGGAPLYAHYKAAFEISGLRIPMNDYIKTGDFAAAQKNIDGRENTYSVIAPIVNLTWWLEYIGISGAESLRRFRETLDSDKALLQAAMEKAGKAAIPLPGAPGVVGPPIGFTPAKIGKAQISGEPSGAYVYINDRLITEATGGSFDITPMVIPSITEGTHSIRIEKRNFEPDTGSLEIKADELTDYKYTLIPTLPEGAAAEAETVYVMITTSNVPDAKIYLDGEYTFTTTPMLFSLKIGQHIVQVTAEGYDTTAKVFELTAEGGDQVINLEMQEKAPPAKGPAMPGEEGAPEEEGISAEEAAAAAVERAAAAARAVREKEEAAIPEQTAWEYTITSDPPGASIYVNGNNTFKKTPGAVILAGNSNYIIMVDLFGYKPAFATVHTDPL
jgi:hypothetical protein